MTTAHGTHTTHTTHKMNDKVSDKKAANGPGHAMARDAKALVLAIDDLIRARIAHVRDAGAGPEESGKAVTALIEQFKGLFG